MPNKARTPWYPTNSDAVTLYQALSGVSEVAYWQLDEAIGKLMGTPQNPVKWSDPGTWIDERLQGENRERLCCLNRVGVG